MDILFMYQSGKSQSCNVYGFDLTVDSYHILSACCNISISHQTATQLCFNYTTNTTSNPQTEDIPQ